MPQVQETNEKIMSFIGYGSKELLTRRGKVNQPIVVSSRLQQILPSGGVAGSNTPKANYGPGTHPECSGKR